MNKPNHIPLMADLLPKGVKHCEMICPVCGEYTTYVFIEKTLFATLESYYHIEETPTDKPMYCRQTKWSENTPKNFWQRMSRE